MDAPAPPPPRAPRRWTPTLAVVAVLAVVVLGGPLVQTALESEAGTPVSVAGIVTVRPLSGWELAGRYRSTGIPGLRLTRGGGSLDVLAGSGSVSAEELVKVYFQRFLAPQAQELRVSSTLKQVRLPSGLVAFRGSYIGLFGDRGTPIEGEVTAVATRGDEVIFDGWAPPGLLQFAADDIHEMIDRARVD